MKNQSSVNTYLHESYDCNDDLSSPENEVYHSLRDSNQYRLSDAAIEVARTKFIRSTDLVDKVAIAQELLDLRTQANTKSNASSNISSTSNISIGNFVKKHLIQEARNQLEVLQAHTKSRIDIINHLRDLEEQELEQAAVLNKDYLVANANSVSSFNSSNSINSGSSANTTNTLSSLATNKSHSQHNSDLALTQELQANANHQDSTPALDPKIATSPVTRAILEASRLASRLTSDFTDALCVDGVVSSASVSGVESVIVMPEFENERVDFYDYASTVDDAKFGVNEESVKVTIAEFGDQILEILAKVGYISAAVKSDSICRQTKYDASLVTNVDLAISEYLSLALEQLTGYPVISEESIAQFPYDVRKDLGCYWLIDPLDGTKGFALGNNHYCHMISFIQHNESVFSCIYLPKYNHQFVIGGKGQGVYTGICSAQFFKLKTTIADLSSNYNSSSSVTNSTQFNYLSEVEFSELVNQDISKVFDLGVVANQDGLRALGFDYIREEDLHQHSLVNLDEKLFEQSSEQSSLLVQSQVLTGVNAHILEYAYEQDFLEIVNYYKQTIRPFYNTYLDSALEDLVKKETIDLDLDAEQLVEFRYNLIPSLAPIFNSREQEVNKDVRRQGLTSFKPVTRDRVKDKVKDQDNLSKETTDRENLSKESFGRDSIARENFVRDNFGRERSVGLGSNSDSNSDFNANSNYNLNSHSNSQSYTKTFTLLKAQLQNYKLSYDLVAPKLVLLTGSAGITLVGKQQLALKTHNFVNEVKTSAGLKTFEVVTRRECSYLLGGLMSEWDLAPAMCLVRELGGVVFDLGTAKYLPPAIFNKRHLDVLPCLIVTDALQIPYLIDLVQLAQLQVPQYINTYLLAKYKKHQASSRFIGELYDGCVLIDPIQ